MLQRVLRPLQRFRILSVLQRVHGPLQLASAFAWAFSFPQRVPGPILFSSSCASESSMGLCLNRVFQLALGPLQRAASYVRFFSVCFTVGVGIQP